MFTRILNDLSAQTSPQTFEAALGEWAQRWERLTGNKTENAVQPVALLLAHCVETAPQHAARILASFCSSSSSFFSAPPKDVLRATVGILLSNKAPLSAHHTLFDILSLEYKEIWNDVRAEKMGRLKTIHECRTVENIMNGLAYVYSFPMNNFTKSECVEILQHAGPVFAIRMTEVLCHFTSLGKWPNALNDVMSAPQKALSLLYGIDQRICNPFAKNVVFEPFLATITLDDVLDEARRCDPDCLHALHVSAPHLGYAAFCALKPRWIQQSTTLLNELPFSDVIEAFPNDSLSPQNLKMLEKLSPHFMYSEEKRAVLQNLLLRSKTSQNGKSPRSRKL